MQVTINLNIDDRYINFFRKVFTKRNAVLALLVAALATNLNADSITKSYTFRGGDTIIASQVNDNFDQLFTKVNDLDAQVTTLEGFGHWSASSGDIYYNNGNVGIGTMSPGHKLEVNGIVKAKGLLNDMRGLAHDSVWSISVPDRGLLQLYTVYGTNGKYADVIFRADSIGWSILKSSSVLDFDLASWNTNLAETPGNDGIITISVRNNNTIEIRNRRGFTVTFHAVVFGI